MKQRRRERQPTSPEARGRRYEARLEEAKRYEGDPCPNDSAHGSERYTANAMCVRCVAIASLKRWHARGKQRVRLRGEHTAKARAKDKALDQLLDYTTKGGNYARERNPADCYPWQAETDYREAWREGYTGTLGRGALTLDEVRALVREARRIWLLMQFGEGPHRDLI